MLGYFCFFPITKPNRVRKGYGADWNPESVDWNKHAVFPQRKGKRCILTGKLCKWDLECLKIVQEEFPGDPVISPPAALPLMRTSASVEHTECEWSSEGERCLRGGCNCELTESQGFNTPPESCKNIRQKWDPETVREIVLFKLHNRLLWKCH